MNTVGLIGVCHIGTLFLDELPDAGYDAWVFDVDAEVVEFCRNNGVDPAPLNEFLELGLWDRYFTGEYEQAIQGLGGLAIWHKDVGYARRVAPENGQCSRSRPSSTRPTRPRSAGSRRTRATRRA